ncbi:MAG: hypothetical protein ACXWW6_07835 [Candidatus Limnocylindrales bacterium]
MAPSRRPSRTALEIALDRVLPAQPPPDRPSSIVTLLRARTLDPELGALLWLLLDGGVSLVVAGPGDGAGPRAARSTVLDAVLDLVPSTRRRLPLGGSTEDFAWLAGAETLGWVRSTPPASTPVDPMSALILAGEIGSRSPADTTGDQTRLVVRALGRGFGLAATMQAARLEDVLAGLRRRPIQLTDDELTNLGIVLVLEADAVGPGSSPRLAAAHYLRPLARDVHGHPQRLPPAVLATWDSAADRFEHFAWGIAAELAGRVGRRTGDFELEQERRAAVLTGLAAAEPAGPDVGDRTAIRATLDRQRVADATDPGGVHRH